MPPTTEGGEIDAALRVGAVTASVAVAELEPSVAVIVAVTLEVKAAVDMVNEALVWPAGTVTEAGTVTPLATLLLDSAMASPPTGAAEEILIVPVDCVPPNTVAGEIVSPANVGAETVSDAVFVVDPSVLVIVAVTFEATAVLETVNAPVD